MWQFMTYLLFFDQIGTTLECGCGNNQDLTGILLGYLLAAAAGAGGRRAAKKKARARDIQLLPVKERKVCKGFWAKKKCETVTDKIYMAMPMLNATLEEGMEELGWNATSTSTTTTTTTTLAPKKEKRRRGWGAGRKKAGVFGESRKERIRKFLLKRLG